MTYKRQQSRQFITASGAAAVVSLVLFSVGCHSSSSSSSQPAPSPTPSATPTPLSFSAQIGGLDVTLFDEKRLPITRVKANKGQLQPTGKPTGGTGIGATGQLAGSTALLYKDGKQQAQMTADLIQADPKTQTVTGTGHVKVRSLALQDTPAIGADKMVWHYTSGTIEGSGNVLITREPNMRLPGKSFTADTKLKTFTLNGGAGPGTGTL